MRTEMTRATSATFAANRAQGAVKFDVKLQDGVTRRGRLHESGSLRVRFPSPEADGLSGVFVNTALHPAVPPGGAMLRTSVMATHDAATIDRALEVFAKVKQSFEAEHGPLPGPHQG